jgi:predicted helicase
MATTVDDIFAEFRDDARSMRDLGDRFERLIQAFLTKDPVYADLFSDVWMWSEWPDRNNKPATGIDPVARERADSPFQNGTFCSLKLRLTRLLIFLFSAWRFRYPLK